MITIINGLKSFCSDPNFEYIEDNIFKYICIYIIYV